MQKVAMTVVALATAGASESPPLTNRADPWGEIARAARRRVCPRMRQSAKLLSLGRRELVAGTRRYRTCTPRLPGPKKKRPPKL